MKLDIRVPMGLMFTLLGFILVGHGVLTYGSDAYSRSLGVNVNLWWGAVILLFGVALLVLALMGRRRLAHATAVTSENTTAV